MTLVLSTTVEVEPGTHPKTIFMNQMTDPYHQEILEEIFKLVDDRDMTFPLPMNVIELPLEGSQGWGGRGRIVLIGDCAHAMRPHNFGTRTYAPQEGWALKAPVSSSVAWRASLSTPSSSVPGDRINSLSRWW